MFYVAGVLFIVGGALGTIFDTADTGLDRAIWAILFGICGLVFLTIGFVWPTIARAADRYNQRYDERQAQEMADLQKSHPQPQE